jgi:hypothetical protein
MGVESPQLFDPPTSPWDYSGREISSGIAVVAATSALKSFKENPPYGHLKDPHTVGPGKDFTQAQKRQIYEANRARNGGKIVSDLSGKILTEPQKSMKGVAPRADAANIDHEYPKSKGGTNSFTYANVLSFDENMDKRDRVP